MTHTADVLVIGAGIVGAACARALQDEGMQVALLDAGTPGGGVTAAGMGHLVVLNESPEELELSYTSLQMWREFFDTHPGIGDPLHCGTLWVAENEQQLAQAHARAQHLARRGWDAEPLTGAQLAQLEPALRPGLAGAVRVRGDAVIYPPAVAHALAQEVVRRGGQLHAGRRVVALERDTALTDCGHRISAQHIVVAAGAQAADLLPELPVFPRKGHLAITDRYPGALSHEVVSMAYGQTEAGSDALAVAANLQPRPTGQLLIGSCRQDGQRGAEVDPAVLGKLLRTAIALMPSIAGMRIIRSWTGMRPATPDGHPLIGAHPGRPGVWLAAGHEGLGVTTAFATARLLADLMTGKDNALDSAHYQPGRFESLWKAQHAA